MSVDHAPQVGIDLAHAVVRARRRHPVATGRSRRIAGEVVAFVNGKDEQGVAIVNPIRFQSLEKLLECLIVGVQLLCIT